MRLPVVRNSWIWVCTNYLLQRQWCNGFSRKHGQSSSFIFLYFNVLYLIKMMDLDLNFRWPKSWQDWDMLHLCTKADFCDSMWGQTWRSGLGNVARSKAWQPLESQLCCSEMEVLHSSRSNLSQIPWDPTKSEFCLETEVMEDLSYCAKVATKARKQFQGQVLTTCKNTQFSIPYPWGHGREWKWILLCPS